MCIIPSCWIKTSYQGATEAAPLSDTLLNPILIFFSYIIIIMNVLVCFSLGKPKHRSIRPDVGSSPSQRWPQCQQTAGWAPGRQLLYWGEKWSTLTQDRWTSSVTFLCPRPSSYLSDRDGGRESKTNNVTVVKNSGQWWNGHKQNKHVHTVQPQVLEAAVGEVVLHNGHEGGHLTEEQDFVVCSSQFG